jgi:serine/threonine-protein kinase RsbW
MASRRTAVAPAVERVVAAARPAGLTDEQADNLAVAVAEALSNAAVHGNRLQPGTHVRVKVAVESGASATVDIADSGPGFDVHSLSDPTGPERVLATGGRGVFLMRRLVDDIEFNKSGNRVRLTVRRRGRRGSR